MSKKHPKSKSVQWPSYVSGDCIAEPCKVKKLECQQIAITTDGEGLLSCKFMGKRKHMVVLGATSEIAMATLKEFAKEDNWHFSLCGRDEDALIKLAYELKNLNDISSPKTAPMLMPTLGNAQSSGQAQAQAQSPYPKCTCNCFYFDALMDHDNMQELWKLLVAPNEKLGIEGIDVLFCAVGFLGDQKQAEQDSAYAQKVVDINFNGLVPIISLAANYFEQLERGHIMVISSVAGDRGRCSNYYYGSSKAAMSAYLSGLRVRLFDKGVQVVNIKPGYVKTRMVAHKDLPPYISASVEVVAKDIVRSYHHPKAVVYTMWLWRYIMIGTKLIPNFIFQRLNMF